jgi:hypothetical protein
MSIFPTYEQCPPFCEGHSDMSCLEIHGTDLDYFMPNGPVVVNQFEDGAPLVGLVEMDSPYSLYTPAQARRLASALSQAADLADRHSHSLPDVEAAREVLAKADERGQRELERYNAERAAAPAKHWSQGPFHHVEGLDAEVDIFPAVVPHFVVAEMSLTDDYEVHGTDPHYGDRSVDGVVYSDYAAANRAALVLDAAKRVFDAAPVPHHHDQTQPHPRAIKDCARNVHGIEATDAEITAAVKVVMA